MENWGSWGTTCPPFLPLGADPAAPMIEVRGKDNSYGAVLLHEPIDRGVYQLQELWDGVSAMDGAPAPEEVHPAGDVDGDGHLDMWISTRLFRGPFVGRFTADTVEQAFAYQPGDGRAVATFDADRDGQLDVVFMPGNQRAYLHYGPFLPGLMPSYKLGDALPGTVTVFGDPGCGGDHIAWP